jgi:inhibitor of KinA sporulation pathway (predicted exonuclease)
VDSAPLLPVAVEALREFVDRRRASGAVRMSWGAYDRRQIERDCARHGVGDPLQLPAGQPSLVNAL